MSNTSAPTFVVLAAEADASRFDAVARVIGAAERRVGRIGRPNREVIAATKTGVIGGGLAPLATRSRP